MLPVQFIPFPTLSTPRLLLRELDTNDAPDIQRLRSDEQVNKYLDRSKQTSLEEAHQFIEKIKKAISQNASGYWVITLKPSDQLIGTVCLWNLDLEKQTAELGYELLPDFQGKGIMKEAIDTIIQFGYECGFKTITALPRKDNLDSIKLLEKRGFQLDNNNRFSDDPEMKNMLYYFLER